MKCMVICMASDNDKLRDLEDIEDDISVGVSSSLHDRSFDELIGEYEPLSSDEAAHIYWYALDATHSTMLIRYLSRGLDASFNAITQTALAHGFAIAKHRYAESISLLESLDDAAIVEGNRNYFKYSDYRISKPYGAKRMQAKADMLSSEAMGQLSATLRCDKAHLCGVCVLLSLVTSITVPESSKKLAREHISDFDKLIKIKSANALAILSLE